MKYCGSCNPEIDLSALSRHVNEYIAGRADITLVPSDSPNLDLIIILCGCLRACVDREEMKSLAPLHLIISGESLGGEPHKEGELARLLVSEIDRLSQSATK